MAEPTTPQAEKDVPWTYEVDHHVDHGGADVYHHVVAGERHICEVQTGADALRITQAVEVVRRLEILLANIESKAQSDRDKAAGPDVTLGEAHGLLTRAVNYETTADALRRVLTFPPGLKGAAHG